VARREPDDVDVLRAPPCTSAHDSEGVPSSGEARDEETEAGESSESRRASPGVASRY